MRNLEEVSSMNSQESSINKLDIAFIAQDSRQVRSSSVSNSCANEMISQNQSISGFSGISRISRLSGKSMSLFQEPSISEMDEWSRQPIDIFGGMKKKKGSASPEIMQGNIEQEQIQSYSSNEINEMDKMGQCSKKRLCQKMDKMNVVTINDISPRMKPQRPRHTKGRDNKYTSKLRSSSKHKQGMVIRQQNESSCEQIQEFVRQLSSKKGSRDMFPLKPNKK